MTAKIMPVRTIEQISRERRMDAENAKREADALGAPVWLDLSDVRVMVRPGQSIQQIEKEIEAEESSDATITNLLLIALCVSSVLVFMTCMLAQS